VVGWGSGGLIALHLAALDQRVRSVTTIGTLASYRSIVEHERYEHSVAGFVPAAVAGLDSPDGYDLPDLAAAIAPRRVLQLRPLDHLGRVIGEERAENVPAKLLEWLKEPLP